MPQRTYVAIYVALFGFVDQFRSLPHEGTDLNISRFMIAVTQDTSSLVLT